MRFRETALAGAFLVDLTPIEDHRGFFARGWCAQEFEAAGLDPRVVNVNLSYNLKRGTLRGLHFQRPPYAETKLVRCVRGAIYDVMVDLRPESPTYRKWLAAELTADNRRALYIPERFGHGFITLTDDTEVMYQVSQFQTPSAEGGARYDDPAFGIRWPEEVRVISDKDAGWQAFHEGVGVLRERAIE